jgi:hypothetical protein
MRALRVLRGAAVVLAEDTRHSRKLLDHFGIRTPLLSCHEHNEKQRLSAVVQRMRQGEVGGAALKGKAPLGRHQRTWAHWRCQGLMGPRPQVG